MGGTRWLIVVALVVVLAGCVRPVEHSAGDGECSATIRFRGAVYHGVTTFRTPLVGRSLGSSDIYGCAGKPVSWKTEKVRLHAVVGVDPTVAVLVRERPGRESGYGSVYVRSMNQRSWPSRLKEAGQFARCRVPASFVGTWQRVSGKDKAGGDYYDQAAPYSGTFQARQGTGLQLDRWSSVLLDAKITEDTHPLPTARFVRRAVEGKAQVAVTTVCRGTAFEVSSIKLAD